MTANIPLEGVLVPVTTPFLDNEEINKKAFVDQLEWMVAQGVHGIVVGGSTGEGYALDDDEFAELVALATNTIGPRLPVVASVIADSTRSALRRVARLAGENLAALQIAPPHYIFSPSEQGFIHFYRDLADASPVPIIIYNVISWAKISPALARDVMHAVPNVIAIKQSGTDFQVYVDLVRNVGADRVFAANDGALMSCYDLGAAGSIAAITTAAPKANVMLWNAVKNGQHQEAMGWHEKLLELWSSLAGSNLPARVKAAQSLQGIAAGRPRGPMVGVTDAERARISSALARLS
jgi:4-hydroxy-tetrahydrodipicolinate synthase